MWQNWVFSLSTLMWALANYGSGTIRGISSIFPAFNTAMPSKTLTGLQPCSASHSMFGETLHPPAAAPAPPQFGPPLHCTTADSNVETETVASGKKKAKPLRGFSERLCRPLTPATPDPSVGAALPRPDSGLFNTNSMAFQLFVSSVSIQRVPAAEPAPSAFTWHRQRSVGKKRENSTTLPSSTAMETRQPCSDSSGGGKFFMFLVQFWALGEQQPHPTIFSLFAFFVLKFQNKILQIYFFIFFSSLFHKCLFFIVWTQIKCFCFCYKSSSV